MTELVIARQLAEVEEKENVRVLLAVEAGSRAWGYASPDSDYDVRFIYVRSIADYLRISSCRDVIEWRSDEGIDMNGWDLKKALLLLRASNPTLFEWNNSPIWYQASDYWKKISKELDVFFNPKAGFCHYLGMAKRTYKEELRSEPVKLKKYFHAMRALLAAKWVSENKCSPPVRLAELMLNTLQPGTLPAFDSLYVLKTEGQDLGAPKPIPELNEYIEKSIQELEQKAPETKHTVDWQLLDKWFQDGVQAF